MKLSLIIPVYNVEEFISRCLLSCIRQNNVSPDDYEIIVIDDGTPDNSAIIAKKILKDIPNSTIIHQDNKGLSEARNTGLRHAKGEYVWFIDSDDFIEPCAISILLHAIKQFPGIDVLMIRAIYDDGNGYTELRHKKWFENNRQYSGTEIFLSDKWLTCAQFYVCRKKLLIQNSLYFMSGVFHEDNEFTPKLLYYAKKVGCLDEILYHTYINVNSITRTRQQKKSFDLLRVCASLSSFSEEKRYTGKLKIRMNRFISTSLNNAILEIQLIGDDSTSNLFNDEFNRYKYLLKHYLASYRLKFVSEGLLFSIFPNYVKVYSVLAKIYKR